MKLKMPTQKELNAGMREIKAAWQYTHYPSPDAASIALCGLYVGCIEGILTAQDVTCPKRIEIKQGGK